ncbi:MAG: hypothetical protein ABI761_07205 [Saprospiraceae bacterium]
MLKDLNNCVDELNQLILSGNTIEAIQRYYADGIVMQENEDSIRTGKQSCLENELQNLTKIKELNCRLLKQAFDYPNQVVFSEWEIKFTTFAGQQFILMEVSVQEWHEDKILKEKFYYKEVKKI